MVAKRGEGGGKELAAFGGRKFYCRLSLIYITHIIYVTHITHIKNQWKYFYKFFLYIKIRNNYYQKHKEKLRKESQERYQNLSEEEKDKRR